MSNIVGRECKHVYHLPAELGVREDTHVIKEVVHYEDGTLENKLRVVTNFKRPFWITKEPYRNHKEKKEAEELERVNMYSSTESDLGPNIAKRLGSRYIGRNDLRTVKDNPYVYGVDVSSSTYIKQQYMTKYPDAISPNTVGVLDIETDTIKDEIIVVSLAMKDKIYTVINKELLLKKVATEKDPIKLQKIFDEKLRYLFNKHVPKTAITEKISIEYEVVENELECIKKVLAKSHVWRPDIIAIWNIGYDIGKIIELCEKYKVDPKDLFSAPELPENLRYFKYMEGPKQKTTESGKFKPVNMEEQWHTVYTPSATWWLDAASTHRYIRVGGKTMAGGYSLDNILRQTLGDKLGKLKFEDEKSATLKGLEWHLYMVANRPLEYIIYNQWDILSMLELDLKTKDLSHVISMLSMISSYAVFSSGPKRIVDALHFFYLENGRVLAAKPSKIEDVGLLGLGEWIVLLPSFRIKDIGVELIPGSGIHTNARKFVSDADQTSGYPSNTMAANVSKDTTIKELKSIEGIPLSTFRIQNINLLFGPVNALEYSNVMFNLPTVYEVDKMLENIKKEEQVFVVGSITEKIKEAA